MLHYNSIPINNLRRENDMANFAARYFANHKYDTIKKFLKIEDSYEIIDEDALPEDVRKTFRSNCPDADIYTERDNHGVFFIQVSDPNYKEKYIRIIGTNTYIYIMYFTRTFIGIGDIWGYRADNFEAPNDWEKILVEEYGDAYISEKASQYDKMIAEKYEAAIKAMCHGNQEKVELVSGLIDSMRESPEGKERLRSKYHIQA